MRIVSYGLIICLSYLTQAVVLPMLFDKGWQPDLFLVWVILLTLLRGRTWGLWAAWIFGLLYDVILGSFFGMHIFPYLAVVYLVSWLGLEIYEEQWYRSVFLVTLGTFFTGCVRLAMLLFVYPEMHVFAYIWNFIWPQMITNTILAIPIHAVLWSLHEKEEYMW